MPAGQNQVGVFVDGPFDPATAKRLESNSARNYFRLK